MASLLLRGNIWYLEWRWRGRQKFQTTKIQHDGKYKNGKPVPPANAKRELRRLENSLDQGRSYDTKTLSELLDLVEKDYETSEYKSIKSLKSRLEHIREWFGNLRADQINDIDFIEYADHRKKKSQAANKTIKNELQVVLRALRLGKIHPLPEMKDLPDAGPRQGFFDDAKILAVTKRLPVYLRPPAWFGYYTGWRREEVFSLDWANGIDFSAGEIRLWTSKNELARVFPMDVVPGLRALLESLDVQRKAWQKEGLIVPWVFARYLKTKKQVRRMVDFRKAWDTACTGAGCPGMIFHDFRRSAARNLELAGWPRSLVMEWMGHETESMFHRYRIVSAADRELVNKAVAKRQEANVKTLKP